MKGTEGLPPRTPGASVESRNRGPGGRILHVCAHVRARVYTHTRGHTEHVRLLPTSVHDQRGQRRPQLVVCHPLPL